jgi:hypothetical protein
MARNNDRDRDRASKRVPKDSRPRGKKKICVFCDDHATWVDYKDINLLKRFMSDRGPGRGPRGPRGEGGERPSASDGDATAEDIEAIEDDDDAEETEAVLEEVEA